MDQIMTVEWIISQGLWRLKKVYPPFYVRLWKKKVYLGPFGRCNYMIWTLWKLASRPGTPPGELAPSEHGHVESKHKLWDQLWSVWWQGIQYRGDLRRSEAGFSRAFIHGANVSRPISTLTLGPRSPRAKPGDKTTFLVDSLSSKWHTLISDAALGPTRVCLAIHVITQLIICDYWEFPGQAESTTLTCSRVARGVNHIERQSFWPLTAFTGNL